MQALNIFYPKSASGATLVDYSHMGPSHLLGRQRKGKKRWGIGDPFRNCRVSCHSVCISSALGEFWSQSRGSKVRVLGIFSKLSLVLLCERKRSSFHASFALALALEEEATGCGFNKHGSDLGRPGNDATGFAALDEAGTSMVNLTEENDAQKSIVPNEGEMRNGRGVELSGDTNARIDVRKLAQSLWESKTADDVDEVLRNLGELPPRVYSSLIKGFGLDKRLDAAFALVDWLNKKRKGNDDALSPNVIIYNSLLGAVKQSSQFERADEVMEGMADQGILPNVVTYNTLMSVYIEQGRHTEAHYVLTCMEKRGIYPSPATYSTALLVYQKMGDASGALEFFLDLRSRYERGAIVRVNGEDWEHEFAKFKNFTVCICQQVMRKWLVKGDNQASSRVLNVLTDMDRAQMSLSRAECEKLVWACTNENHLVVARELYRRIRDMETGISLSVCNHVIWLMGKAKKWWTALEIYEDLLDMGPKPNNLSHELIISHFNVLLSAARKRGIWRWGVELLNKMQDKGLKPGAKEWNAVLVSCSRASEASAAVQIFRKMVDQGEKPTIVSYGALLSALEKGKLYDEALLVWEHMCKVGIKPNLYAYTILATMYIGKGRPEQVDSIICDMISSGIEPTVVTYNAIISGCARNNLGSAALEWFHRMKIRNIVPNEITYEMLIEALARDAKPRLAYEMYLRAHNEGLHLSSKAYDAVVRSSQLYGASIEIDVLGPRPPDKKNILKFRKTSSDFCKLKYVSRREKPFDKGDILFTDTKKTITE
uniref:Pentatricopeptide repeat-containing protein At3g46610 n=1 Tax=Anthurium amnicola TaxID=1678845 RepID=A0A1D1Z739_9ARAE